MKKNKKNLIFLTKFIDGDLQILKQSLFNHYNFIEPKNYKEENICKLIKNADVAVGNKITEKYIDSSDKLCFYQHTGSGIDNINLDVFKNKDIIVSNTHSNSLYVAEYAIALMFNLIKKINIHDSLIRKGIWFHPNDFKDTSNYLSDTILRKNIGILGYGHIAKKIITFLKPYKNEIYVHRRIKNKNDLNKQIKFRTIDFIAKKSDILFICLPLTKKTNNLIDISVFKKFKKSIIIINISRAEIINESQLYLNLKNKNIGGAAIDVWYNKQKTSKNIQSKLSNKYNFTKLNNLIISPHRAGYVLNNSFHLNDVIDNLIKYAKNMKVKNIVNIYNGY